MSTKTEDTIVAVSTAAGFAMRAIVRLSGPAALHVAGCLFEGKRGEAGLEGFTAVEGLLFLPGEALSVPAVLYTMRAPYSYTREDVTEIHLPGSPALVDVVLDVVLCRFKGMVRLATPGEFTQRAFLNGRIDLAQAESVMSLITARNRSELIAANSRLQGKTSRVVSDMQKRLTDLRAAIEAALDFDVQGIEIISSREFIQNCDELIVEISNSLGGDQDETSDRKGRIKVVLCGPPNAGKSSLLNCLCGHDGVIVHALAGTTRDPVEENIEIEGIHFSVTDTAGLAGGVADDFNAVDSESKTVDQLSEDRARRLLKNAQLLLLVFDASEEIPEKWRNVGGALEKNRTLCVFNKSDLPQKAESALFEEAVSEVVHASAINGEGIDELRDSIARVVIEGGLDASPADSLFNARQRDALRRSSEEISEAMETVESGFGYEFAALHLREASQELGRVTGEAGSQDVLDRVFSRFCVGK